MNEDFTRRRFVGTTIAGAAVLSAASSVAHTTYTDQSVPLNLTINGQRRQLNLDSRVTLLDALREHLELSGTKKGCDHGQCGACTVLINNRRVNSCLRFAIMHDGDAITTVEGLAKGDELHPVQAAFIEHDAFQCGYCTPGQICSAVGLLSEAEAASVSAVTPSISKIEPLHLSDQEIRERMSGNICRCGAYPNIVAAVRAVYGNGGRRA